jgi:hypothetical protein
MFKRNLHNSKRGNFADIVLYIAIALVFIFTLLLVYIMLSRMNTAYQSVQIMTDNPVALQISQDLVDKYPSGFDWILPIIYVMFLGFSVWSAGLIPSTNKFFFIGIFVTILLTFFSLMMENFWDMFKNHPEILNYTYSFPMSVFILDNLRYFTLFYCFMIMILLYSRRD